jgi:hypothetical protein
MRIRATITTLALATGLLGTIAAPDAAADGALSPQLALIQGSLNKPCAGLPVKVNQGSLGGVLPVSVLCSTENSTQEKGDEPLSKLLQDLSVLSTVTR